MRLSSIPLSAKCHTSQSSRLTTDDFRYPIANPLLNRPSLLKTRDVLLFICEGWATLVDAFSVTWMRVRSNGRDSSSGWISGSLTEACPLLGRSVASTAVTSHSSSSSLYLSREISTFGVSIWKRLLSITDSGFQVTLILSPMVRVAPWLSTSMALFTSWGETELIT